MIQGKNIQSPPQDYRYRLSGKKWAEEEKEGNDPVEIKHLIYV